MLRKDYLFWLSATENVEHSSVASDFAGGLWAGQAFSLEVEEELFHEKSKYQDVFLFKRFALQFSYNCLFKSIIGE